ncbi:MAG: TerD family protein [Micrococcales bacterium]|nr:TerD family protein [Micrococcales bacterium]
MSSLSTGENRPWVQPRFTVYVPGTRVSALVLGSDERALGSAWVDATAPARGAVQHLGGAVEGVTIHLPDVEPEVARVLVVATGYSGPPTAQLLAPDGSVVHTVTPPRIVGETALVMVEVYRRESAWKVRAVARGHDGGLAQLAGVHGAPVPVPTAAVPAPAPVPPGGPAPAAAVPAAAAMTVDPVRQIGMILEDASRTTASFESSEAFAQQRLEQDLERIVEDPSMRVGPQGDAARAEAQRRCDALVAQARARYTADLAQLTAELQALAQVLPAPLAPWSAPAWQREPRPDDEAALAFRIGDLVPPSAPDFRLPIVRVLPLAPPVWIDLEGGGEVVASQMMAALTTRLVLALPRAPRISVVDIGGRARLNHLPTAEPPATDPTAAGRLLAEYVEHTNLVMLARSSGRLDDLPPQHQPGRLLLLPDFPHGLDDSSVMAVQQLAATGEAAGVNVVFSGRRPEGLGIPVLEMIHGSCLSLPTAPGGDLTDVFGGVSWVFHPDTGPDDPFLAERVQVAVTRRVAGRDRI